LQPFEYSVSVDEANEADKPKPIRCANIEFGRRFLNEGIKMAEISKVPAELAEELKVLSHQGLDLLSLTQDHASVDVVAAITERVRNCKASGRTLPEGEIFALGALLGSQYVEGQGWHLGDVVWDFDETTAAVGVLNHDNSLFINPIGWVAEVMESEGGVGFMLNYNMVSAHQVLVCEPDSATGLY
jgi:hypothetical protein